MFILSCESNINKEIIDDANQSVFDNSDFIPKEGKDSPLEYEGMKLVWADEFQKRTLDEANWTYRIGNGDWGWGNNEKQYYRKENTSIYNKDFLVIEAKEEEYDGFKYTSSRLVTENKKEFKFGRVDIRAALPKGQGIWPALWMLGGNFDEVGWPACGEMDIMELLGHIPDEVHSTVHYGKDFKQRQYHGKPKKTKDGSQFSDQFHVFSLVWEKDNMKFLLDDELIYDVGIDDMKEGQPYPFNKEFFFLFNVAVGGNWPGDPNETTTFPQRMIVDYIRVFQKLDNE